MPYIKPLRRPVLDDQRVSFAGMEAEHSGELNYVLTVVVLGYLQQRGLSYATCADIVSALDNAKDEFRRRIQHPYEDQKRAENGDVYQ